jgi:hypothetical protein
MDAGYALAVETYVRLGMDVLSAAARVDETIGLEPLAAPNLPTPIDNAKALADLQAAVGRMR